MEGKENSTPFQSFGTVTLDESSVPGVHGGRRGVGVVSRSFGDDHRGTDDGGLVIQGRSTPPLSNPTLV